VRFLCSPGDNTDGAKTNILKSDSAASLYWYSGAISNGGSKTFTMNVLQ
jgi:hypothetical protein